MSVRACSARVCVLLTADLSRPASPFSVFPSSSEHNPYMTLNSWLTAPPSRVFHPTHNNIVHLQPPPPPPNRQTHIHTHACRHTRLHFAMCLKGQTPKFAGHLLWVSTQNFCQCLALQKNAFCLILACVLFNAYFKNNL